MRKCSFLLLSFSLLATVCSSQSLNERLEQLSGKAAQLYIAPAFNSFGININGGWLNKPAAPVKSGLNIEFGVVGMGTYFNQDLKSFRLNSTFRFDQAQAEKLTELVDNAEIRTQLIKQILEKDFNVTIYGPSIIGSTEGKVKVGFAPDGEESFKVNDSQYPFPVYVKLPSQNIDLDVAGVLGSIRVLPSAAPQIKVGTLYGTQAIVRFLPGISMPENFGKLNFFGFGLQHNPNVWFNGELPIDFSMGFLSQKISVENVLEIKAMSYGLNAGKTLGSGWFTLTPYAGFMMEKSSVNVHYAQIIKTDAGNEDINVNFDLDGQNKSRIALGLYVHMAFVNINMDYNFGSSNSFTGGLLFNF